MTAPATDRDEQAVSAESSWQPALRGSWLLLRDLVAALLILVGLGIVLGRVVESDWFLLEAHLLSQMGFPELRLAAATAPSTCLPSGSISRCRGSAARAMSEAPR